MNVPAGTSMAAVASAVAEAPPQAAMRPPKPPPLEIDLASVRDVDELMTLGTPRLKAALMYVHVALIRCAHTCLCMCIEREIYVLTYFEYEVILIATVESFKKTILLKQSSLTYYTAFDESS